MSAADATLVCDIEVTNRAGIHTRVALMIFKTIERFQNSSVSLTRKETGQTADCHSVLELLSLGAACGDAVTLSVNGPEAETLQRELLALFENNFFEDEEEKEEESETNKSAE